MFTGLIEDVGRIAERSEIPKGVRLGVETELAAELGLGDSVAVNGVCLTVVERSGTSFVAEVSPETARVTTVGGLTPGARVNLERPLRAGDRFGGHFVLGHVDGMGRITGLEPQADFSLVSVSFPPALAQYFVSKGSIAVDGISLTVAALRDGDFDVQIVPFTWDHTNLQASKVGDAVNLECDIIGKYVVSTVADRR